MCFLGNKVKPYYTHTQLSFSSRLLQLSWTYFFYLATNERRVQQVESYTSTDTYSAKNKQERESYAQTGGTSFTPLLSHIPPNKILASKTLYQYYY